MGRLSCKQSGDANAAVEAVRYYKDARRAWATAAEAATGKYAANISYGPGYFQKGHWADRLPLMDADIADMEKRAGNLKPDSRPSPLIDAILHPAGEPKPGDGKPAPLIDAILKPAPRPAIEVSHPENKEFKRGADVPILIRLAAEATTPPILHYRHVNQAEQWQRMEMKPDAQDSKTLLAVIPAAYTDSAYPLQYYFELRNGGRAVLSPGFNADWSNQPYYVIRQTRAEAAQT